MIRYEQLFKYNIERLFKLHQRVFHKLVKTLGLKNGTVIAREKVGQRVQEHLEYLRVMTPNLPSAPSFPSQRDYDCGYTEYPMVSGRCFGRFIWRKNDEIAIHHWINTPGEFPKHAHEEDEILIVHKGSMTMHIDDTSVNVTVMNPIVVKKGTLHWATFEEDCEYITNTMPPSKDFPYPGK